MKHEQVVVDYWTMVKSSLTYLALIFCGWCFLKLLMACFWLPSYLEKNDKKMKELLETVEKYEKDREDDGELIAAVPSTSSAAGSCLTEGDDKIVHEETKKEI